MGTVNHIELSDCRFRYPDGSPGLDGVSLNVAGGSRVAVLGGNGAGKTTLFMVLKGLYRPGGGEYRLGGRIVAGGSGARRLVGEVGLVFQDPEVQLFAPSVGQEVAFGPANLGLDAAALEQRVDEALAATGITALRHRPPQHLSCGEKKRVAIAGVIAMDPAVVLLDEPLAWLDRAGARAVMAILESLHDAGKTVICSTHSSDFAWHWADSVVLMKEGRVLAHDEPARVFDDAPLMAEAGLETPLVLAVARRLGIDPLPRTRESLLAALSVEPGRGTGCAS